MCVVVARALRWHCEGRVFRKGGGAGLTLAQAATRAIELGGSSDGRDAPADVNRMTKVPVAALTGQCLVAAARDHVVGRFRRSRSGTFIEISQPWQFGKEGKSDIAYS